MEPKFEPKQYTSEEIANLEKSRTISDAELLKGGAEYSVDEKGEKENLLVEDKIKESLIDKDALSTLGLLGKTFGYIITDPQFIPNEIRNASPELIRRIVHNANKELYLTYRDPSFGSPEIRLWNDIPSMTELGHPDWNPSIGLAQSAEGLSSTRLRQLIGEIDAEEVRSQGSTTLYIIHRKD
ncbi:MAG: hypothetical protein UY07_C0007G0049 [Parcubacteria group bacterium GW2011_GWA1_47_8]|nr:MAG: hypothetical protein UY07_C0007G0049 [Parcubacteria group bacterium GW2011_GWA1_47_8]KKW07637.1 MAG: hypothetical protein UY42_C0009G0010 [Parcubacteria group bacterium GW2011_GWA2_49_16]